MEYEFIHDAITGEAKARFSLEHEIVGPWLEIEVGQDSEKLAKLLSEIDNVELGKQAEVLLTGHEFSVAISKEDVVIQANSNLNGEEELPEMLTDEHINFDSNSKAECGIDDFRTLLLAWAKFTFH